SDAGATWAPQDMPGVDSSAWPFQVTFDSRDPSTLYYGNFRLFKSTDNGNTWIDLQSPHADQTAVALDAASRLWSANDGGLYRAQTSSGSISWLPLNSGLSITEFYKIASHSKNPSLIAGGSQDNGTAFSDGKLWSHPAGGDGGRPLFDENSSPNITLYAE